MSQSTELDGSPSNDLATTITVKPPTKKACKRCRSLKARCPGPTADDSRCAKCIKAGTECVVEEHKRGRKVGTKLSDPTKALMRIKSAYEVLVAAKERERDPSSSFSEGSPGTLVSVAETEEMLAAAQSSKHLPKDALASIPDRIGPERGEGSSSGSGQGKGKDKGKGRARSITDEVGQEWEEGRGQSSRNVRTRGCEGEMSTDGGSSIVSGSSSYCLPTPTIDHNAKPAQLWNQTLPHILQPPPPSVYADTTVRSQPSLALASPSFPLPRIVSYNQQPTSQCWSVQGGSGSVAHENGGRESRSSRHSRSPSGGSLSGRREDKKLGRHHLQPPQQYPSSYLHHQPRNDCIDSASQHQSSSSQPYSSHCSPLQSSHLRPLSPSNAQPSRQLSQHAIHESLSHRYQYQPHQRNLSSPYALPLSRQSSGSNPLDNIGPSTRSCSSLERLLAPVPPPSSSRPSPAPSDHDAVNSRKTERLVDDPVSRGILTEEEARSLFDHYIRAINPTVYLLDPVIHTHDLVRSLSPILYSTILSTSVKFSPAPIYTPLKHAAVLALAREHLLSIFKHNEKNVESVQALCLMTEFREVSDENAYLLLGMAIRVAMDIELGRGRKEEAGVVMSEDEERWERNRRRIWMWCFMADRRYSGCAQTTSKPTVMSLTPTIVSYSRCFHLSPLRTPSDTRFTAACALRILMSSYSDIITANADRSPSTPPVNLRAVYESSEVQVDRWQKEWTELVRKVNGLAEEELELTAIHAKLMVAHHWLFQAFRDPHLLSSSPDEWEKDRRAALGTCLGGAIGILKVVLELKDNTLRFLPDSSHLFCAYATFFLSKMFSARLLDIHLVERSGISYIFDLISRAAAKLEIASLRPSMTAALHGRLLRSLTAFAPSSLSGTAIPAQVWSGSVDVGGKREMDEIHREMGDVQSSRSVATDGSLHPLASVPAADASPATSAAASSYHPPPCFGTDPISLLADLPLQPQSYFHPSSTTPISDLRSPPLTQHPHSCNQSQYPASQHQEQSQHLSRPPPPNLDGQHQHPNPIFYPPSQPTFAADNASSSSYHLEPQLSLDPQDTQQTVVLPSVETDDLFAWSNESANWLMDGGFEELFSGGDSVGGLLFEHFSFTPPT